MVVGRKSKGERGGLEGRWTKEARRAEAEMKGPGQEKKGIERG